jgi:hypothetical protein
MGVVRRGPDSSQEELEFLRELVGPVKTIVREWGPLYSSIAHDSINDEINNAVKELKNLLDSVVWSDT